MVSVMLLLLSASALQLTPGDHSSSVNVAGVARTYDVHVPTGYDALKPTPLVLVFHGLKETPATMAEDTELNKVADTAGFIAVYPAGSGAEPSWNAGTCCNPSSQDVEFVKELLNDITAVTNVDTKRVYAMGMSNGAMMVNRLACEMPDTFAAIGTVAGTRVLDPCAPHRAIPVIHFHGTADKLIPFGGRPGSLSVPKHIDFWVKNNKANPTAKSTMLSPPPLKVTEKQYSSTGAASAEVVLVEIEGGGHLWPGRPRPARITSPDLQFLLGETTQSVSANDLIWAFFLRH